MPLTVVESPLFKVLREQDVPVRGHLIDDSVARKQLADHEAGDRKGCYIFAISKQNSLLPWYVGKATKSFSQEVFNQSNINKYNKSLQDAGGGKPKVFFIATPQGPGATNLKAIKELEDMLIQDCGGQNPNIVNKHQTTVYKICIAGVKDGGQGKPSVVAQKVRKLTGRK